MTITVYRAIGSDAEGWTFEPVPDPPPPSLWHATCHWHVGGKDRFGRPKARACTWAHPLMPGLHVRHCCHPTALRPYYVTGPQGGYFIEHKFGTLGKAQAAAIAEWTRRGGALDRLPHVQPPRAARSDPAQGSLDL